MRLKLKSAATAVVIAVALASSAPSFGANMPTSYTAAMLTDQAALKAAVDRMQRDMAKVAQDVLNIQANQAGSNNAIKNMMYQAALAADIARMSADGTTMNNALKKLQTSSAPLFAAHDLAIQSASKKLDLAVQAKDTKAQALAQAELNSAAQKANADRLALFGSVVPGVTTKVQASIKKVTDSCMKLGNDYITGAKTAIDTDKAALLADFKTLMADFVAMTNGKTTTA